MKIRKATPVPAQETNKKKYSLPRKRSPEPKPLFLERMQELLPDEKDYKEYLEILKHQPVKSFRCNKLKISPENLKEKLEKKYNWKINQPWKNYPEVMIVEGKLSGNNSSKISRAIRARGWDGQDNDERNLLELLEPGELGRALEHLLGYYYIQELASMLPVIAIKPKENEKVLDLCSSPGSKTTQIAAEMNNTGSIIANEVSLGRIRILASNLERCGVTNTIITKKDGVALCNRLKKENFKFDKILVDAPCSGEGTLRSSPKTYVMWNPNTIRTLSKIQKQLFRRAFEILKVGGEIIYSTCTHAPEENEAIVDWVLNEFKDKIEIEQIELPIKPREGICCWQDKEYSQKVKKCARVYPHDNNTEGFFVSKFRRKK